MADLLNVGMVVTDIAPATGEVTHTFNSKMVRFYIAMDDANKAITELRGAASGTGFNLPAVAGVYGPFGGTPWANNTLYIASGGSPTLQIMEELGSIRDYL